MSFSSNVSVAVAVEFLMHKEKYEVSQVTKAINAINKRAVFYKTQN